MFVVLFFFFKLDMTDRVLLTSKMPETGSSCLGWEKLMKTGTVQSHWHGHIEEVKELNPQVEG